MFLDSTGVTTALTALGDQLDALTREPIEIVVCGGSALQALGLVNRVTRDIDVLALARHVGSNAILTLATADPLPDVLVAAAAIVRSDLGLPGDWLNHGPTGLLTEGLPEGLEKRLHTRRFGTVLTVHFIDRVDQIAFKAYALVNGGDMRHLSDLEALKPSDEEMLIASRWVLTQDAADFFPELVRDFLRKIGYANVADRL